MVICGNSRGNGSQLASYLLTKGKNDNVSVFEIRGTANENDLKKSLLEMSLTSELTKSEKGLYHAVINPGIGEDRFMTPDQWLRAADILENELRLSLQKRAIVFHEKNGRTHAHVVWERYDHETGKMISDSFSRLAQDRARKIMEQEFNHTRTPDRNLKRPEIKATLTELWGQFPDATSFMQAAQERGYVIASGTKRPYMVIDSTGRSFDLVRQLEGVKTMEVRERFKATKLPKEKAAITQLREAKAEKKQVKAAQPIHRKSEKKQEQKKIQLPKQEVQPPPQQAVNDNQFDKKKTIERPVQPPISWSMSTHFVINSTQQEQANTKLAEVVDKAREDEEKRQKLVDEMKRRLEIARKFRDNELDMEL